MRKDEKERRPSSFSGNSPCRSVFSRALSPRTVPPFHATKRQGHFHIHS